MPYVENRIVHDADSHLMELDDCLDDYIEAPFRNRYHGLASFKHKVGSRAWAREARRVQGDPAFRAEEDANILSRKNYQALGSFLPADRPRALNLLGFASQLVFTTFCLGNFGLDEALAAAQLNHANRLPRSAVNRAYYAMFYGVLALLAVRQSETSRHSGAISQFDELYVKPALLPKDFSRRRLRRKSTRTRRTPPSAGRYAGQHAPQAPQGPQVTDEEEGH